MSTFGRYSKRYDRSEFRVQPPPITRVGTIPADSTLLDIADADFRTFRVHCWPGTEREAIGVRRRWGKRDDTNVVILPFRFRAGQTQCRVQKFDVDVEFSAGAQPEEDLTTSEGKLRLIGFPVPERVEGRTLSQDQSKLPWNFSSVPIPSEDGFPHGARWTWESNDHDPCYLHGAAVVQHRNIPFTLQCKVRGEAAMPLWDYWPRISYRFRFDSNELEPRRWTLSPRPPAFDEAEFEDCVKRLHAEIESLNVGAALRLHQQHTETDSPAEAELRVAHRRYGDATFAGASAVHQGDRIENYHIVFNTHQR